MVWLRWRRLACPASTSYLPRALPPLSSGPRPPTIFGDVRATSLALCVETAPRTRLRRHVRGFARRDGPPYLPRYSSSAALCGETDPRTCLGTPRPRLCAERRTPVPASVRLVRGFVRRDGPPYLPRYASSAALCGETDPRTCLGTPRPRLCAERRTPVPASVRLVRGFVRRDGPPYLPRYASSAALCGETDPRTCLGTPRPRLCAERRTPVPASVRLVRGFVRRDGPPYLPRYASSAALCGETDPRTCLGTPRTRLCAERRTRVPASVRLVRGFVRRDAPAYLPRYASSAFLCGETDH